MIIEKIWREYVLAQLVGCKDTDILRPHAGKVLQLRAAPFVVNLMISTSGIPMPTHPVVTPDATIILALGKFTGTQAADRAEGDSEFLEACSKFRASLDLMPEAAIEHLFGPVAGSAVARGRQCMCEWGPDATTRLGQTCVAWLTKESGWLPEPEAGRRLAAENAEFARRVEALRQAARTTLGVD